MAWERGSLTLKNHGRPDRSPVVVEALADAGAWHLCIPESIRLQLALDVLDSRDVTRADGTTIRVAYVGQLEVRCKNRVGCTGALVMGDQVVLVIHPTTWTVEVNPESPDLGISWAR